MDSLWMSYGFRSPLDFLRTPPSPLAPGISYGLHMDFIWISTHADMFQLVCVKTGWGPDSAAAFFFFFYHQDLVP